MKTTLKDVFNNFDDDFNIDEKTICENIDVDFEKITMNAIQNKESTKKHNNIRKKLPLILIAAALTTTIIGTTAIAAVNLFKPDFSDKFKGDNSALTIYSTDDFKFETSDSNLNAEFLGMTGDQDFTVALIELTRKDGSVFQEDERDFLINDYYYGDMETDEKAPYKLFVSAPGSKNINEIYSYENAFANTKPVECYLSNDRKTLKLYITINNSQYPSGSKVTFSNDYYKSGKYKEEISEYISSSINDDATQITNDNFNMFNTAWKYTNGTYSLYSYEETNNPLSFNIEFTTNSEFDNKSITSKINSENAPTIITDDRSADLVISPFKISLIYSDTLTQEQVDKYSEKSKPDTSKQESNGYKYELETAGRVSAIKPVYINGLYRDIDPENSKLILKDGTVYYFYYYPENVSMEPDKEDKNKINIFDERTLLYTDIPYNFIKDFNDVENSEANIKSNIVNPKSIAKIMVNGDIIYTAEGCENISFQKSEPKTIEINKSDIKIDDKNRKPISLYTPDLQKLNIDIGSRISADDFKSLLLGIPGLYFYSIDIAGDNKTDNSDCLSTETEILLYSDRRNIFYLFNTLAKLSESDIFVTEVKMTDYDAENDVCTVNIKLATPYAASDSVDKEALKNYIISKYGSYEWNKIICDYLYDNKLPDKDVPFSVDNNLIPEPEPAPEPLSDEILPAPITNPVKEAAAEPVKDADMSNYKPVILGKSKSTNAFKSDIEKKLNSIELNDNAEKRIFNTEDEFAYHTEAENDTFKVKAVDCTLNFSGDKTSLYNCINRLVQLKKDNLFIEKISLENTEANNGTFDMTIVVEYPFVEEGQNTNLDKLKEHILSYYSKISESKLVKAFFDGLKDVQMLDSQITFIPHNEDGVIIDLNARLEDFEKFIQYKEVIDDKTEFNISENFELSKLKDTTGNTAFKASIILTTEKFKTNN